MNYIFNHIGDKKSYKNMFMLPFILTYITVFSIAFISSQTFKLPCTVPSFQPEDLPLLFMCSFGLFI